MIGRIRGVLLEKHAQEVLIDVQGVGYEVHVPMTSIFQLPEPGNDVLLYTHFVVREDAQLLFGFISERERSLFRILIRVNGVGPKMALTVLSGIEAEEFVTCVEKDDINALVRLPGVGRKTAERLILDVRDRIKEWDIDGRGATGGKERGTAAAPEPVAEAETALVSLGYKPREASEAVRQASRQLEQDGLAIGSESLIRLALKNM